MENKIELAIWYINHNYNAKKITDKKIQEIADYYGVDWIELKVYLFFNSWGAVSNIELAIWYINHNYNAKKITDKKIQEIADYYGVDWIELKVDINKRQSLKSTIF